MFKFLKTKYKITRAFKRCFCDEDGNLTDDGKIVLAFFRDEACAKGELGKNGSPYFYDEAGRFDRDAAIFLQGKRRMFDLFSKHLALEEKDILNLIAAGKDENENLMENLNI